MPSQSLRVCHVAVMEVRGDPRIADKSRVKGRGTFKKKID